MPTSPIVLFLYFFTIAVCIFAILKGSTAERLAGTIILGNIVFARVTGLLLPPDVDSVVGLIADGLTALALLMVILRFPNPWLGVAMLLYGVQFTLHSFYSVTSRPHDRLHVIINNIDFFGISTSLALGVIVAWRRRHKRRSS